MKIIIAAAAPFIVSFLKKRLQMEGYAVESVDSRQALIAAAAAPDIALVMVHVELPGNGLEACGELRGICTAPAILFSGDPAHENACLDAGARAFLLTPFSEDRLTSLLSRVLHGTRCILLVDDSKVIHQRTGSFLEQQGMMVLHAYDGEQGIAMARGQRPDLIVSDIEMPRMDGYTMCKRIKTSADTALIPTIIVSSLGKGLDIDRAFDAGANDYLIKPVVHEELLSCIDSLLHTMEVRRRETVLVVDDSPTIVNMLRFGLMQQGFRVIACTDGEDAYEQALRLTPDVIVADLDMPRLNGYQLIKYLKEREVTRSIPVVIISSRESRAEAARGLRISAAAFVSKPFSMDKVAITVERLTAESRLKREREYLKLYMSEAAMQAASRANRDHDMTGALNASEKNLTILFSDIVGFTSLCEQYKPMEVVDHLNSYFDIMTTILKDHGAIIDKFIGDAILAIFGSEDDSQAGPGEQAVRAALCMIQAQDEFNKSALHTVQTRIGINSGQVIFGDIGSKLHRRDFTVIGDPVNVAQRLQAAAPPDSIYISENVYRPLEHILQVQETGDVPLKGKSTRIKTYCALGFQ
jgi:DNA-binding response OmpR family regulator